MFYELMIYTTYLASRAPRDSVDQAVNSFVIDNGLSKKDFRYLLLSLVHRVWFRVKCLKQGIKNQNFVLKET